MSRGAVDTMLALLRGERPANVVNPEVYRSTSRVPPCASHDPRRADLVSRVPSREVVRLGIGRSVKRDAVLVRVETDEGHVGWGEAHHGRCPGAIAKLVDTTLRELVLGMDAFDVNGVWARVYKMQLASHGMGAAAALALSGLDIALWDLRCQATGWPLYRCSAAAPSPSRPMPAASRSAGRSRPRSPTRRGARRAAAIAR